MGRKKKTTSTSTAEAAPEAAASRNHHLANGGRSSSIEPSLLLLKRAYELKEEGNRLFQLRDYAAALHHYELALKLTPRPHPDRAVYHSNRAACLLLMPPVDHRAVARECTLALQFQPNYPRALLRRARALEALGDLPAALADVDTLLSLDPSNRDALELSRRFRSSSGNPSKAQSSHISPDSGPGSTPKPQSFGLSPNTGSSSASSSSHPSPAALGASAVGAPIAGLGPCLPSRGPPVSKKTSPPPPSTASRVGVNANGTKPPLQQKATVALKPTKVDDWEEVTVALKPPVPPPVAPATKLSAPHSKDDETVGARGARTRMRPLKLVYDHDIRLAQMPLNCRFQELREIVGRRFPCSKAVLVKYKDPEGDLVTVTSTEELRMAESCVDGAGEEGGKLGQLRLYVVEVSPEQEPLLEEEEEEEEEEEVVIQEEENPSAENNQNGSSSVMGEESIPTLSDLEISGDNNAKGESVSVEEVAKKEKVDLHKDCSHPECKEAEMDDWLFEFAQLFRTHVGIDPDAHLDLHELGNDLCSEALEETVTSEEAQTLFEMAASKFQEVAALAYFNWGNVHMCSARKKIALNESAPKDVLAVQLQSAYDWINDRYILSGQKYEEALRVKPDFYEGLLALGQQNFEVAKLQWSFTQANKVDLTTWDSTETLKLFDSAEEKMKAATEIWERLEELRANGVKDPAVVKREELLKKRKKHDAVADGQSSSISSAELTSEEAAEQAAAMRSQIHLFWANMLYERSQVEFKLGIGSWKKNFDDAVERFKLAGASETDISVVIKNHSSNEVTISVVEEKVISSIKVPETSSKDEDKHIITS